MSRSFEAIVIGSGPAGETAASKLAKDDLDVALIERELVGGECAYWACIPSKTLLRPPEARAAAVGVAGLGEPESRWEEIVAYRNYMIRDLDDSGAVSGYEKRGVSVFKGAARITGPGRVAVDGEELEAERIVIATGSEPVTPPIDGIERIDHWTNREATTLDEVPSEAIVLGGGPVGIELGQMLRRYGAEVTIVEASGRLLDREDPRVGELIASALREEGIELRLDARATAARQAGGRQRLELEGGEELAAERVVLATGRRPRTENLGIEHLGIELGEQGEIPVDDRCRAAEDVWAIGDVTGIQMFTHLGTYQARIACADVAGRQVNADYRAIPRVVFSDPEIAAVGLTKQAASEQGMAAVEGRADLARVARAATFGERVAGEVGVVADRQSGTMVGAWAVGPLAGEWIHQAVLAVKAKIPVAVLRDTVAQFPTFSEAYRPALEDLEL